MHNLYNQITALKEFKKQIDLLNALARKSVGDCCLMFQQYYDKLD